MASNSSDPVYRAGLHAATCSACGNNIGHGEERVNLRASWRSIPDILCRDCWLFVLTAAGMAYANLTLDQAELPLN